MPTIAKGQRSFISYESYVSQDSSFEWKSESQFKFLHENPCTHTVLGALCDTIRFFWIQCHLVTKLKGWNPLDITMGIKTWVGVHSPTAVWRRGHFAYLWTRLTGFESSLSFTFFSILLKLEFYIFCNNDQVRYFPYFLTVGSVILWAHNTSLSKFVHFFELLQRKPRTSDVSPCKVKNLVATLSMIKKMFLEKLDAEIAKMVTSQLLKDQVNSDQTNIYSNRYSRVFENFHQFYGMSIKLSFWSTCKYLGWSWKLSLWLHLLSKFIEMWLKTCSIHSCSYYFCYISWRCR